MAAGRVTRERVKPEVWEMVRRHYTVKQLSELLGVAVSPSTRWQPGAVCRLFGPAKFTATVTASWMPGSCARKFSWGCFEMEVTVFPVEVKNEGGKWTKKPAISNWQLSSMMLEDITTQNFGMNILPGWIVVDLDLHKNAFIKRQAAEMFGWEIKEDSLIQTTISGGEHHVFKIDSELDVTQGANLGGIEGLDIRCAGGAGSALAMGTRSSARAASLSSCARPGCPPSIVGSSSRSSSAGRRRPRHPCSRAPASCTATSRRR